MRNFKAKLVQAGNNMFFEVPFDVKAEWGKARAPVVVTLGRFTFTTSVAVYGGRSVIGLRKDQIASYGIKDGQTVNVRMELDTSTRKVDVPADLAQAMNKTAKAAWDKLSYTHQKEHARAIEEAKKPETRARRVEKAIEMLLSKSR